MKTIEELENFVLNFEGYDFVSNLMLRCQEYSKIPICDLDAEQLRPMIGQNFAKKHLVPLALDKLKTQIVFDEELYDGILLNTLFRLPISFWKENSSQFNELKKIVTKNSEIIKGLRLDNFEEFKDFDKDSFS